MNKENCASSLLFFSDPARKRSFEIISNGEKKGDHDNRQKHGAKFLGQAVNDQVGHNKDVNEFQHYKKLHKVNDPDREIQIFVWQSACIRWTENIFYGERDT